MALGNMAQGCFLTSFQAVIQVLVEPKPGYQIPDFFLLMRTLVDCQPLHLQGSTSNVVKRHMPMQTCVQTVCCIHVFASSQIARVNVSVTYLVTTDVTSDFCTYGGLVTLEISPGTRKENNVLCHSTYNSVKKYYSHSTQLTIVLYWYKHRSRIQVNLTISETKCKLFELDPCVCSLCLHFFYHSMRPQLRCRPGHDRSGTIRLRAVRYPVAGTPYYGEVIPLVGANFSHHTCIVLQISKKFWRFYDFMTEHHSLRNCMTDLKLFDETIGNKISIELTAFISPAMRRSKCQLSSTLKCQSLNFIQLQTRNPLPVKDMGNKTRERIYRTGYQTTFVTKRETMELQTQWHHISPIHEGDSPIFLDFAMNTNMWMDLVVFKTVSKSKYSFTLLCFYLVSTVLYLVLLVRCELLW